ncbi:polysaccharide deacetylase family protein [Bacillus luteolus]|uniref:Polysaccharide deacetylase family protein n=1 Tax=Litchfieldia luteola TaxID=682179 RepID=A0ABR9QMK1_9BACI|nr:polysaccharide deacetylase family protein [Cytobacillus luteolus]MBE4909724.1 polysaccharide deacetylase family protein [Cytobacillus luteolus]MBP1944534.1 peptidoglycan/xylan/chitin deacetylase (PgdA/CDA1 family) [Cytobacillus luteolus]
MIKKFAFLAFIGLCLNGFFTIDANATNVDEFESIPVQQIPEDFPQLEGGPETTERVRYPVSNIVLQQRYPETIVLSGPSTEKRVALTFDDGPDPRFTGQVLDVLNQYNVDATFFVMGARAETYPDLVKRMINEEHIVGNHTYWHPNLVDQASVAALEREVNQTEEILENLIGYRTKLFRAPYGFLYNELVEKLRDMNYTVVGWSVDSLDWQEEPPTVIANTVTSQVQPGSIILMHDGGEWDANRTPTIQALQQIIPTLKEQGYEFVTVPELLDIPYKK